MIRHSRNGGIAGLALAAVVVVAAVTVGGSATGANARRALAAHRAGHITTVAATNNRTRHNWHVTRRPTPLRFVDTAVQARCSASTVAVVNVTGTNSGLIDLALDARIGRAFAMAVSPDNSGTDTLTILNTASGAVETRITKVTYVNRPLAVDAMRGHLYIGSTTGLEVVDPRTTKHIGRIALGREQAIGLVVNEPLRRLFVLAGRDSSTIDSLSTVDTSSDAVVHTVPIGPFTWPLGDPPTFVYVDARAQHAFLGTTRGILVLDARRGVVLRTLQVAGWPVAVDTLRGQLFVEEADHNRLRILTTRSGVVLHTVQAKGPAEVVAAETTGRVFVDLPGAVAAPQEIDSHVLVLDARTGLTLHTATVHGNNPHLWAVDELPMPHVLLTATAFSASLLAGGLPGKQCKSPIVILARRGCEIRQCMIKPFDR